MLKSDILFWCFFPAMCLSRLAFPRIVTLQTLQEKVKGLPGAGPTPVKTRKGFFGSWEARSKTQMSKDGSLNSAAMSINLGARFLSYGGGGKKWRTRAKY